MTSEQAAKLLTVSDLDSDGGLLNKVHLVMYTKNNYG